VGARRLSKQRGARSKACPHPSLPPGGEGANPFARRCPFVFLPPLPGEGRGGGTTALEKARRPIEGLPPSQPSPGRGRSKTKTIVPRRCTVIAGRPDRVASRPMSSTVYALLAIALWTTLASLGTALWKVPASTLALGIYGLFGYHFLLFIALRWRRRWRPTWSTTCGRCSSWCSRRCSCRAEAEGGAPAGSRLRASPARRSRSWAGAARSGAGPGVTCPRWPRPSSGPLTRWARGASQRFPTAAIGLFGLVSGVLSLVCHVAAGAVVDLSSRDWLLIAVMGLGPLGAAFFLWDKALKTGDARHIGILSYITPLASTTLLVLVTGRWWAPPATWPGASCCRGCSTCAAPASFRAAGSSACRSTRSTSTAFAPSRARPWTNSTAARHRRPTGKPLPPRSTTCHCRPAPPRCAPRSSAPSSHWAAPRASACTT
jgi:hypothetical protein